MTTLPNIVFITCHDLGRHLNCYGWKSVPSPALDRLAAEGVRMANSFCTAPQCSPSRAALLTGQHAHSIGVLGLAHEPFNWWLDPSAAHLAHRLQALDYHTILFGEQHVTQKERTLELGYDKWFGLAPAPQLSAQVVAYLRSYEGDRPLFVEVGFTEPHRPYDWGGATADESRGVDIPPYLPDHPDVHLEFAALQGAIRQLDEGVGIILAALEELGLHENTFVVFVTDHGLAMPRAKCTLYDPGIETTLLMRWPASGVGGGRVFEPLISHVDIVPTVLEAIGVPVPVKAFHGKSFWNLLQDEQYRPNHYLFAEKTFHTAYEPMRAVRTETHKLILNFETGPTFDVPDDVRRGLIYPHMREQAAGHRSHVELYDLERDPQETVNLAGRAEMAEIERSLRRRLQRWMEETDDPLLQGPPRSPFYTETVGLLSGRQAIV